MKHKFNISLEAIAFQSGVFYKELIVLVGELRKLSNEELADINNEIITRTVRHIFTHIGLRIDLRFGEHGPVVNFPQLDRNNVLINAWRRQYLNSDNGLKMIRNAEDGMVRGSVNIMTSKASGVFSEVESKLTLPFDMIRPKQFTDGEVAAALVHELGHIFTYFEYLSRTVRTNQALAGLSRQLDGSSTQHEREVILMDLKTRMNLQDLDVAALSKTSDKTVIEVVVIANFVRVSYAELGSDIYDLTNFEYVSDQFATRHGAGRDLVTGLDKFQRASGDKAYQSNAAFYIAESLKAGMFIISATAVVGGFGVLAVAGSAVAAGQVGTLIGFSGIRGIMAWSAAVHRDNAINPEYDRSGMRFKRIRLQLVERLKEKTKDPEDQKSTREDIIIIDNCLKFINDREQWFTAIMKFIGKTSRNPRDQFVQQEKLQYDLEQLQSNDFFIKHSELTELI